MALRARSEAVLPFLQGGERSHEARRLPWFIARARTSQLLLRGLWAPRLRSSANARPQKVQQEEQRFRLAWAPTYTPYSATTSEHIRQPTQIHLGAAKLSFDHAERKFDLGSYLDLGFRDPANHLV
jgi:hypothetical protein